MNEIRYCVTCAAELVQQDPTVYNCPNGHIFYNNPAAATSILLINDQQEVLFAKRAHEPKRGEFDLPGGFVEFGEDAYDTIRREIKEEAGVELEHLELLDAVPNMYMDGKATCDLVFISRKWLGDLLPADDVELFEWHPLEFMQSDQFAWEYPGLYERLVQKLR